MRKSLALTTVLALVPLSLPAKPAPADEHVVPLSSLRTKMVEKADARAKNLQDIDRVLGLPAAQDELRRVNLQPAKVRTVLAQLDDQELQRLADRARSAETDVEGGFIVGILALIGLIVVIIIVVALVA